MKKSSSIVITALAVVLFASGIAMADKTEKVHVIKFDLDTHDMIVERDSGELLLIQHNRKCGSMTTEFPIDLIWGAKGLNSVKVAFNEICKVYNYAPYSGEITILRKIPSPTILDPDHQAELVWQNKQFLVDYGDGCKYIGEFENKPAFVSLTNSADLVNAKIILPNYRGQCAITKAEYQQDYVSPTKATAQMTGLRYQEQNGQVYFYWDPPHPDRKITYMISFSRNPIDISMYKWDEMPNLVYTNLNEYTLKNLANGRKYYVYLNALDEKRQPGTWVTAEVTPVNTTPKYDAGLEPDLLTITMAETPYEFILSWQKKENVRKHLINLFINGKRVLYKLIPGEQTEWKITKLPEYNGKKFRFTVKTMMVDRYAEPFSDAHYWVCNLN
jgi:hypothetical protein